MLAFWCIWGLHRDDGGCTDERMEGRREERKRDSSGDTGHGLGKDRHSLAQTMPITVS